ncbi:MAG: capsule biosynthesis protein CapA [Roseobacter sp.]
MTSQSHTTDRVFLFLQGPHGPFFNQLAKQLRRTGAQTWRVGFNAGDRVFWSARARYIPFRGTASNWPRAIEKILEKQLVTDVVIYGDTRPVHALAIAAARRRGIRIHIFEEGYIRPYWVTYECNGTNGNSALMNLSIDQIRTRWNEQRFDKPVPPSHWGDLRQHVFYGALYHWFVLCWNYTYPNFEPHRNLRVMQEFLLYLKRLTFMPIHGVVRRIATRSIKQKGFPYHLVLLQLEHDSAFQHHGPFKTQADFLAKVMRGFAKGAPSHHHLVFKAHPLEDGRSPLQREIKKYAQKHGITERVHYIGGGKLAGLLNEACSATTINSTSGQQALWRGIPLRVYGAAVYAKPELVSQQTLAQFFADPHPPDVGSYQIFRNFLLATSQLPGSFYAKSGRCQVIRQVVDLMLEGRDPYAQHAPQSEAVQQQLRLVPHSKQLKIMQFQKDDVVSSETKSENRLLEAVKE